MKINELIQTPSYTHLSEEYDIEEGWIKNTLAAGALAGAALTGAGQAQAADLSHYGTPYLQQVANGQHARPMVSADDAKTELELRAQGKQQTVAPAASSAARGFSKEYLQSVVNGTHPRPMISVEKAQQLLGQMNEEYNPEYSDEAGMAHGNLITIAKAARGLLDTIDQHEDLPEWVQEKIAKVEGMLVSAWNYLQSQEAQGIDPRITEVYGTLAEAWSNVRHHMELVEEFNLIENIVESIADRNGVDSEAVWADLESLTEDELYVFAVTSEPVMEDWQKANKRDKTDGMSRKAVKAYRREHPGSKLQTAVTTKPSKLKTGSKASKRRKSYCSRSRGQMKMHNISCAKTPDKAICKARRRWNC